MPEYFDMHCHLLYGVDDGPKEMEEALQMLRQEYDDGVRTVYLTPHYRKKMFECPADTIARHFEALQAQVKQALPELKLRLGCEIHVSMDVVEDIKSGRCATMSGTELVLLEFSETAEKKYILERCHAVINKGYVPIVAHAERCVAVRKDIELLQRLQNMGAYIQMSAGSIIGEDGFLLKRFCRKVMQMDLLDFVGSDAHDMKSRKVNIGKCADYIEKTMGADYRDQIMCVNPMEIVERSIGKRYE
ncbi:MAG: capsular biosynthesis protein [Oscillospiraceae bacterium]|nr:capsular biosynthesis protein [Oscillospiraceae bacterium]